MPRGGGSSRGGGSRGGGGMSRGGSRGFSGSRGSSAGRGAGSRGSGMGGPSGMGSASRRGGSTGMGAGRGTGPRPGGSPGGPGPRSTGPVGGSGMGAGPRRAAPPPPPPRRRRRPSLFIPFFMPRSRTVYVNSSGSAQAGNQTADSAPNAQTDRTQEKKRGIPGWYKVLCVVMVIVVIALLISAARSQSAAEGSVTREKLGADACTETTAVLQDELEWISDTSTLKKGIDYFYDKTGVQPYLLICGSLDGKGSEITDEEAEASLEALYDSLYEDEGHMIFAFMEYESGRYITWLYTGRAADSVIDSDAREIFLSNVDLYYDDTSLSDEEFFAKVFTTSADTIMEDASGRARSAVVYVVLAVLILIVMAAGLILFRTAEQKRAEAEEMEKILRTPVGGGSTENTAEEEDLIHKYSDPD